MPRVVPGPLLVALAITGVATACGGDGAGGGFGDQSPEEIRAAVAADMTSLQSLHLVADLTSPRPISLDLRLDAEGTCVGTVVLADAAAEIITVDGTTYLKGSEDFWSALTSPDQGAALADLTHGRWATMPAERAGFADFCDLGELLSSYDESGGDDTELSIGEEDEIDGQPAIELVTREAGSEDPTTSWVATAADGHYVLRIERSGASAGTITLSDFDEPVSVTVPSGDDHVVDLG